MANSENETMKKISEVNRLTKLLPLEGEIRDSDTVLADILMEADYQENGIGFDVMSFYQQSRDKELIKDLFYTLTGTSFDDYLEKCIEVLKEQSVPRAEEPKSKWINLGDLNFLDYGGCLVKPHYDENEVVDEDLKYTYDVFYLNTEYGENGDQNFAALCCVDLTDSWIEWNSVMTCGGYDDEKDLPFKELVEAFPPEVLAKEVVNYYGVSNFSPSVSKIDEYIQYPSSAEDYTVSKTDLKAWLTDIDAKEYV